MSDQDEHDPHHRHRDRDADESRAEIADVLGQRGVGRRLERDRAHRPRACSRIATARLRSGGLQHLAPNPALMRTMAPPWRPAPLPSNRRRAATLREVVEALAPLERRPGSAGEREAADWLAERLAPGGCEAARRRGAVPRRLRARDRDGSPRAAHWPALAGLHPPLPQLGARGGRRGDRRGHRRRHLQRPPGVPPRDEPAADDLERGRELRRSRRRSARWSCSPTTTRPRPGRIFDDRAQAWLGEPSPASSSGSTPRCRSGGRCSPHRRWSRSARCAARRGLARTGLAGSLARRRRCSPTSPAARSCPGANDNLTRGGGARRARRAAARGAGRGAARAARLLRRRGGPPGRHPRLRRTPLPSARPRPHLGF